MTQTTNHHSASPNGAVAEDMAGLVRFHVSRILLYIVAPGVFMGLAAVGALALE